MNIKPMLADLGNEHILKNKNYIFEIKLDGIRAICFKNSKLKFFSRNGIDITRQYPEFNFLKNIKAKNCVLDGEIVVYDEYGNPNFTLWQERKGLKSIPSSLLATYVVFDILSVNGKDLTKIPLRKRKDILEKTVKSAGNIQTSFCTENGLALWKVVKSRKLEGIIAKDANSLYEFGRRNDSWLKIKIFKAIDCIILGFTKEKRELTSLALGLYFKNSLIYSGKVGTGFDESTIKDLSNKLNRIRIKKSSIGDVPDDVFPVKPMLVAEVKYQEITKDKKLRAPVFLRLRHDKELKECVLEI